MTHRTAEIGRLVDAMRLPLADAMVDRFYSEHPDLEARYGERGRQKCRDDALQHLAYLSQALAVSQPVLFREYISWAKVMLAGRGIPADDLAGFLRTAVDILNNRFSPEDAALAREPLEAALGELPAMATVVPSFIIPGRPHAALAKAYFAALLACQRHVASRLISEAVGEGVPIKELYLHVFQESQHEIGRLWQTNEITVAQEHYCTAATQMIMSQLYPQIFAAPKIGRRFVGASVSGNLHDFGIRMVTDFFEMDGWDTVFLGASVPEAEILKTLQSTAPDVIGISATMTPHVAAVAHMISAIRGAPGCGRIKILVGGYPFLVVPDLWKEINADGCCASAQGAVDLATRLVLQRGAA